MNFSTYRFTLDLHKHQSQMSVAVFQYDTAVRLSIGITDGGVPYHLEDGVIARLVGEKANGTPIVHNCSIEENSRIIYTFNKATSDIVGIVNCQIRFYKVTGGVEEEVFKLTAPKFIIVVGERVGENIDSDTGDGEFSEQFSALDNLFVNESARVLAEKGRAEAEAVRAEAEQDRAEAEAGRAVAEAKRVKAEKERESKIISELDNKLDIDKHNALEERVSDLESLTLTYTEDTEKAYEKSVPTTDIGKYALVKRVGGATKVAPSEDSKNLINPYDIYIYDPSFGDRVEHTVNGDGSITLTLSESIALRTEAIISVDDLGNGKFYYLVEGADVVYTMQWNGENDALIFEFNLPWDYDSMSYYDYTWNVKVMVYKYGDSDRCELTEAPSGTVFEPYLLSYQDAKLERIDSIGANLFNEVMFEQIPEVSKATYKGEECYKIVPTKSQLIEFPLDIKSGKKFWFSFDMAYPKGVDLYITTIFADGTDATIYGNTNAAGAEKFVTFNTSKTHYKDIVSCVIKAFGSAVYSLYYMKNLMISTSEVPYKPYKSEPIDSIVIPQSVRDIDGFGREGSYIECVDGVWTLTVTKDEKLSVLSSPIVTGITHLINADNAIEVEGGGTFRFVNENEMPVPNTIAYVTRKE